MARLIGALLPMVQAALITDVQLTTDNCPSGYQKVDTAESLNGDLNQGSGGKYIYLCTRSHHPTAENVITGLTMVSSGSSLPGCGGLNWDWHRVSVSSGNGDLNQGSGGKYIYLCYTKVADKAPLSGITVLESGNCYNAPRGSELIAQQGDSNGDANQGAGGKYIYFCQTRAEVLSATLMNTRFPTLGQMAASIRPSNIGERAYCNPTGKSKSFGEQTVTKSVETGSSSCFSMEAGMSFGASITAEAEIPFVASGSAEAHWEASMSMSSETCHHSTTTEQQEFSYPVATLDPHTAESYQLVQRQGLLSNIPYTASLLIRFRGGDTLTKSLSGTYSGAQYSHVEEMWSPIQTDVSSCGGGWFSFAEVFPHNVASSSLVLVAMMLVGAAATAFAVKRIRRSAASAKYEPLMS